MDDLSKRLRNDVCLTSALDWQEHVALAREAADTIDRQRAVIAQLVEAGKPFAALADDIEAAARLYKGPESAPENWAKSCQWEDLVRLRTALAAAAGDGGEDGKG